MYCVVSVFNCILVVECLCNLYIQYIFYLFQKSSPLFTVLSQAAQGANPRVTASFLNSFKFIVEGIIWEICCYEALNALINTRAALV